MIKKAANVPATNKLPDPNKIIFQEAEKNSAFQPVKKELVIDRTVKEFWGRVYRKYFFGTAKTYGRFNIKSTDCFESYLQKYFQHKDIAQLSISTTDKFMDAIKSKATTGGLLFFCDFNKGAKQYIFIVLLKDSKGFKFVNNHLTEVPHLDISKIHFAALIDIDGWRNNSANYLSFVKGQAKSGEISNYFTEFVGCEVIATATESTNNFVEALKQFALKEFTNRSARNAFFARAVDLINIAKANKTDINLASLCNSLHSQNPKKLLTFIQQRHKVNASFSFMPGAIRQLEYHSYQKHNVKIVFPLGFTDYDVDIAGKKVIITVDDPEFLKIIQK